MTSFSISFVGTQGCLYSKRASILCILTFWAHVPVLEFSWHTAIKRGGPKILSMSSGVPACGESHLTSMRPQISLKP